MRIKQVESVFHNLDTLDEVRGREKKRASSREKDREIETEREEKKIVKEKSVG